jgi:hypothetical protein
VLRDLQYSSILPNVQNHSDLGTGTSGEAGEWRAEWLAAGEEKALGEGRKEEIQLREPERLELCLEWLGPACWTARQWRRL